MKRRLVRVAVLVLGVLIVLAVTAAAAFRMANRTNGRIVSSGEERAYLLYVPESYDPTAPTPLVITIHGFAQWPAHQMDLSGWNDLADEQGFIVVYPAGTAFPLRWRAGGALARDADPTIDVTFISDLIDRLEDEYNIDPARIYANGLSNGGGMSFLLSCALSDRIAAVGMVSGAYLLPWEECTPERPVPAIVFHGTDDRIVPYWGGTGGPFRVAFPSIPEWVETLALENGCDAVAQEFTAGDGVDGLRYTDCDADVVFYTIAGGGHTWPGGQALPPIIAGSTTDMIDATRTIWEFFQEHPLVNR